MQEDNENIHQVSEKIKPNTVWLMNIQYSEYMYVLLCLSVWQWLHFFYNSNRWRNSKEKKTAFYQLNIWKYVSEQN